MINISRSFVLLRNCISNNSNLELIKLLKETIIAEESNQDFILRINASSNELKSDINNVFNDFDGFFIKYDGEEKFSNVCFQVLLIKVLNKIYTLIQNNKLLEASNYADTFHFLPESLANHTLNYHDYLLRLKKKHVDTDIELLIRLMQKHDNKKPSKN